MSKPLLLDLYCGAGGAVKGYIDAGFDVIGVDIVHQPDYPGRFVQSDAIDMLRWIAGEREAFAAIHASPPCQADNPLTVGTNASRGWGGDHASLTTRTVARLEHLGIPYVVEQPDGRSPLRRDLRLCGEMFGLGVIRHRHFQLGGGFTMLQPQHLVHRGRVRGYRHGVWHDGPYVAAYGNGGGKATVDEMRDAMGIDWTTDRHALTEAIPPAYTRHIGTALHWHLEAR